ncbi:hypothetical protein [Bordetella bronchiseptica]|uniref:hypothetical protein n=1 Tax=Bordetella bronchiseptica TaxID=518 RepID=UPI0005282632|nr:hypothetical protein [Bordetella bronchiseptica]
MTLLQLLNFPMEMKMGVVLIVLGLLIGSGTARAHQAAGGQTGVGTLLMFLAAIALIGTGVAKLVS